MTSSLEAVGKTSDGDTDDNDEDEAGDEEDDKVGPAEAAAHGDDDASPTTPRDSIGSMASIHCAGAGGALPQHVTRGPPVTPHEKSCTQQEDAGMDMNVLVDGYIYAGKRAHTAMDGSAFIVTDRLRHSYITTAALRRLSLIHI